MKVYICASTKNLKEYYRLRDELRLAGHFVFDWSPLLPEPGPDFETRKDEDPHGHIFIFASNCCATADLVVLIGPAGADAGAEIGIAYNAGVPVWAVAGKGEKPGAVIKGCVSRWFPDLDELVLKLTRWRGW